MFAQQLELQLQLDPGQQFLSHDAQHYGPAFADELGKLPARRVVYALCPAQRQRPDRRIDQNLRLDDRSGTSRSVSASRSAVAACGFGLRITPIADAPLRLRRSDRVLVLEVEHSQGWRAATIDPADGGALSSAQSQLADVARVEVVASRDAWWIETPLYRIPLPALWTLHSSGDPSATPLFELLGPSDASIWVRTTRRMPALESFQGPGHAFRDIGQLDRAGWIEFEHTDAASTWLHRHEQFHRGTTPFVVTLKAPLDRASACMAMLATIVEQLELTESELQSQ
jgi:hypothetical protein